MAKFDIKKEYPKLYRATTKKISSLTIPMIKYIAIDGIGNPTVPNLKINQNYYLNLIRL